MDSAGGLNKERTSAANDALSIRTDTPITTIVAVVLREDHEGALITTTVAVVLRENHADALITTASPPCYANITRTH